MARGGVPEITVVAIYPVKEAREPKIYILLVGGETIKIQYTAVCGEGRGSRRPLSLLEKECYDDSD